MWTVYEHRNAARKITRLPQEILKRYEKWKDIVNISGPEGLKLIKGFHGESLSGQWAGHRSSRLGLQYRVIYRVEKDKIFIEVIDITAHDYRRK